MRMTKQARLILTTLLSASDPQWGYRLCKQTGLPSATVSPALRRFAAAGIVRAWDEVPPGAGQVTGLGRPLRRFYELTDAGRDLAAGLATAERSGRG